MSKAKSEIPILNVQYLFSLLCIYKKAYINTMSVSMALQKTLFYHSPIILYVWSVFWYVIEINYQSTSRLARDEMRKQELRQRVRVADNEVMEGFRRIMAARQKKRTPTKKEKDQAWKALKERESILKLLDG